MDKTIVENFVKASEIKIKISNKFDKNFNFNNVNNELRNLIIEILIHPELFEFFGKDICEVLNKNKNKFDLNNINEILSVFWKNI